MEKLIKSALGQWKIVSRLGSTGIGDLSVLAKNSDYAPLDHSLNNGMTQLFNEHAQAMRAGDKPRAESTKGEIKNYLLQAPKGSIDIGHMGELKRSLPHYTGEVDHYGAKFNDSDAAEVINHHVGDKVRSLKGVHDKFGDGGLKTLMHTMGANGNPMEYSNLKLHPSAHADLLSLVHDGKGIDDRGSVRHLGVLSHPPWHDSQLPPGVGESHEAAVHAAHSNYMDAENDEIEHPVDPNSNVSPAALHANYRRLVNNYENAVVNRGLATFHNHYKNQN